MADTITEGTLQLARDSEAKTSLLVKGKRYVLADGKFTYTPPAGVTTPAATLEGEELLQALKSGLSKASKSATPLSEHAFGEMESVAKVLASHPEYGSFLDAHAVVGSIENSADLRKHMAEYVTQVAKTGPEAEVAASAARTEVLKLLSKDTSHGAIPKAELEAFKKALPEVKSKKGWDILQATVKDAKSLTSQIASASFGTDAEKAATQLKTILAKNHKAESGGIGALTDLMGDKAHETLSKVEGLDVHGTINEFAGEVSAAETQLKAFAEKTAELKKAVATADVAGKQAALDALKAHADEVKDYFAEESHAAARGAAFRDAPSSIRSTLNAEETIKAAASKASSGLGIAEKAIDTGKGSWFTKSAEEIAKVAESKGVAVEKIGRWGRRTTAGKAGIVIAGAGAAYGLYSVVAGTGNKGPGERAASVSQGRENEPAMAR